MEQNNTAVATLNQPVPEFRLIARDPQELEASRQHLVSFFGAKVAEIDEETKSVEENLSIALKFPINTRPLKAQLNKLTRRRKFYEKAKAAVEAGFHIIPNFIGDVFAIRTTKPAKGVSTDNVHESWALSTLPNQQSEELPVGQGRYVSPRPAGYAYAYQKTLKDNSVVTRYQAEATEHGEIDFPFLFARPEVLTATQQLMAAKIFAATQQLMAAKIFDELVTLPQSRRKGDPMVAGVIKCGDKRLTFFAIWFLDTTTL